MDCLKKSNICRICLEQNGVLSWNYEILELCGETYKDCYYKYTQLQMLSKDPYSQMLCQTCAIDLKISHSLVVKALKSHAMLQKAVSTDLQIISHSNDKRKGDHILLPKSGPEFEMLVLEEYEESLTKDKDDFKECLFIKSETSNGNVQEKINRQVRKRKKLKDNDNFEIDNAQFSKGIILSQEEINDKEKTHIMKNNRDDCEYTDSQFKESHDDNDNQEFNTKSKIVNETQTCDAQDIPQVKKVRRNYDRSLMCSICSKMFMGYDSLRRHERTHQETRERTTTCPECGVKLLGKYALHAHSQIHNQNREKKHKCEFCEKAYFNHGALNVHRRIHLGQMIPCPICSKEYARQIDLKIHMAGTHTEAPLNTDAKIKSKYYVYCKECDKQIRSVRWKGHQSAHLKDPLLKCSICDKEFFNRSTCTYHMRKTHNYLKKDDYEPYIIYLKPRRISHLMMGSTPVTT